MGRRRGRRAGRIGRCRLARREAGPRSVRRTPPAAAIITVVPNKNDRNVVTYRRLSSIYDWGLQRNPLFERPRARLFELADIKSGERVLVVGVGTGLDLLHLPAGADAIGVDLSPAMLARAQTRVGTGSCSLRQMSAEDLDFDDDSFDVVVMSCVLSVVGDPHQALAEAARVLRPSGSIWILGKFCEATPTRARRALSRALIAVGGASLTRSLTEAIGTTPLRVNHHEHSPAADIIRLTPH